MTNMAFFTKLDSDYAPKPWRADQRPNKHIQIDFAAEKGFTISGDVRVATDGWVTAYIRVDFPAGMKFNGKDFSYYDLSIKNESSAWIKLRELMNDVLAANKEGAN
jgi:hypothetical protein